MVALEPQQRPADDVPILSQTAAGVFAGFGLIAALGLGWTLARSSAGIAPFQLKPPVPGGASIAAQAKDLRVVATDLKFDSKEIKLEGPGQLKIHLENQGVIEHDFSVEGLRGKAYAGPKKSGQGTFQIAKAGTYVFYCSIPGHKEAGMQGKLVVAEGGATIQPVGQGTVKQDAASHTSHASVVSTQKAGNQLLQPTIVDGVKVFNMTVRQVQWEVLPGVFEEAMAYNDQVPGPLLRVTDGEKVRMVCKNEMSEPTIVHFHGPRLPNAMDGVPDVTQPVIKPGESFAYEFVAGPAGTYMYHSHHNSA